MTTTAPALWTDLNGSLRCLDHGGDYLQTAVAARPRARQHTTPITLWRLVDDFDRAEWDAAGDLPPMACEVCRPIR